MESVLVRYIVDDVDAAVDFYTTQLDFKLEMRPAAPFAMLSRGPLRLAINAPNNMGGGGRSMPDGTKPEPGGWNRFTLQVEDLDATVVRLRESGARFRNEVVSGMGGRQVILEDPSGNPIELFEPANRNPELRS
ncbi:MAG TPA: VOC family protein [Actinomycetota bacterium]|nr:VOC family protein [Actinomycetota bacterium]